MPKKTPKKEVIKKKRESEKPLSLYPLDFDEAMKALIKAKPPPKSPPKKEG